MRLHVRRYCKVPLYSLLAALIGSNDDSGFGCRCFLSLKCVNAMKPAKDTKKPKTPINVIGILKNKEVMIIAKIRRMQFKAAW